MNAADTLGVVQSFPIGNRAFVEDCLRDLASLGIKRLRTQLSWATYLDQEGAAWYAWLFGTLARRVEVLPYLCDVPPSLSLSGTGAGPVRDPTDVATFVDSVIDAVGNCFGAIELWRHPTTLACWDWRLDRDWQVFGSMITVAAERARRRGKRVILGAPSPHDPIWLRMMGERGVLRTIDGIGISAPVANNPAISSVPDWHGALSEVRQTVSAFNPALGLWITDVSTGPSVPPVDQIRAFLAAADSNADRVYWSTLRDDAPGTGMFSDTAEPMPVGHSGLMLADGRPKLIGRLLPRGVTELRRTANLASAPAILGDKRPLLITGGAGFIGCNLADRLASDGESVLVLDSLARPGVEENLAWLRDRHPRRVAAVIADVRDPGAVADVAGKAGAVFHLAAQVAVTSSMVDPAEDLQVNLLGTFNLLQALRRNRTPCIFASTNKVYGHLDGMRLVCAGDAYQPEDPDLRRFGWSEDGRLDFRTPYGCSKGAADQYVLDYAGNFGVPTAVMRMSCIYGPHQRGTEDQGWVAHFVLRALAGQEITVYGDGRQVRDILYVDDAVRAYIAAWRNIHTVAGTAFNLGGGPDNAISLLQLIEHIESLLGRPVAVRYDDWRPNDQRYYVSDTRRVRQVLSLPAPRDWRSGVAALVRHLAETDAARLHSRQVGLVMA